jgi:AbrB family looped-hinge helix DNA binding protein
MKTNSPTSTPPPKTIILTLSAKGQFTLPKDLRTQLGARPGDRLVLGVAHGELRITRLRRSITEETAGSLRRYVPKEKLGKPWKEIIETTQRLVAKQLAEEGARR